ncbi:hypothetical protein [Massilia sp. S19_KUP03_FR1]|uniref:hypothetical protein n=1 Tax=Massilia sp. S19_KUP03_FR1 TaxID=3025503 RepID=UPI002FCDC772
MNSSTVSGVVTRRTSRAVFDILLFWLAFHSVAQADSQYLQRGAGAAGGIVAGIYIHELGHAAVSDFAGAEHIRIRIPGAHCKLLCGQTDVTWSARPSAPQRRLITVAGFVSSNVAAEIMLQHESLARSGFGQGLIATNLYSNAVHVFSYYTKVRGRNGYQGNDIDSFELAGGNPHLLSAGLLAYSAYALHRMHKKHIPVLFVSARF